MKILYLSPQGIKRDLHTDPSGNCTFDFESISRRVAKGVTAAFDDELINLKELLVDKFFIEIKDLVNYDLFLCDITTGNANIAYVAGMVEGLGKPIIYFASSESTYANSFQKNNILSYSDSTIENAFLDELNITIDLAKSDPISFSATHKEITAKPKVFISYSHKDKEYLDRLMVHLKPLSKKGLLDVWVDTRLKTGDLWQEEIEKALTGSGIAILMISSDFMASDFIIDNELPPLLSKAEVKGTKILPVILSPCRFSREPSLSCFQAVNQPDEPLSSMNKESRETIYDKLAHDIEVAINNA